MLEATLANVAVILMGYLLLQLLVHLEEHVAGWILDCIIILVVFIVIICLFYLPITYGEYRFDLRLIPLLFLALFSGWRLTVPVVVLASLWRYFVIGGEAAVPAIVFALVIPTLFVLLFYRGQMPQSFHVKHFFILSFYWLLSDIPVIFTMDDGWEVFKEIGLIRYASFIVVATMIHGLILNEIKKVRMQKRLEYYANYCLLTGVRARSRFLQLAEEEFGRLRRASRGRMTLAMLDVDQFKRLNDSQGHLAGDAVLKSLGRLFSKYESERILFGRYGGDEFVIVFLDMSMDEVEQVVGQLQADVEKMRVSFGKAALRVSISIGLHEYDGESSLQAFIQRADEAMYRIKMAKRNEGIHI